MTGANLPTLPRWCPQGTPSLFTKGERGVPRGRSTPIEGPLNPHSGRARARGSDGDSAFYRPPTLGTVR